MRKTLLATSALALAGAIAAGPVSAADMPKKLTVGVGGYMQQWVAITDLDNAAGNGGVTQYSDSEIFFRGKLEADSGLSFSVKVEFEGNTHADVVDESQATVSGSFGSITLGSEDHVAALMHYGNQDVGVGLACGDVGIIKGITGCATSSGKGLGTSGWIIGGDAQKISYLTPRMNGVQFGASYIPDAGTEDKGRAPTNNDEDAWSVGLNYKGNMGDASVAASFGHYQASQVGAHTLYDLTATELANAKQEIANYAEAVADGVDNTAPGTGTILADLSAIAADATETLADAMSTSSKADDQTWTNFGLQVGMGAFGFDVAYAVHDGGAYMVDPSDPNSLVEKTSSNYDVTSVGAKYSDGPMAVSLSHMMTDADDGTDSSASILSVSYALAPGIASRTSLISAEQDGADGTAFITGITLGF